MSVTPSPIGGFAAQFFDNNGVILSGGKIYTYAAGTTTPQATYTSASGTTPHANPIILDSAGRVPGGEIWLTDGLVYKFVIETATGSLLGTYDNITGVNSNFVNYTVQEEVITATAGQTVFNLTTINYTPGTNSLTVYIDGVNQYVGDSYLETDSNTVTFTAGLHVGAEVKFTTAIQTTTGAVDASIVSYDPPFANSVATNVEAKLEQYVSVKDFGAVGDGVADDTSAFQAAIDSGERSIFIPSGTYKITAPIDIPVNNGADAIHLHGAGKQQSILQASGTFNTIINIGDLTAQTIRGRYENFAVSGTGATVQYGIYGSRVEEHTFFGVWAYGFATAGVSTGYGYVNNFIDCEFSYNTGDGLLLNKDYGVGGGNNAIWVSGCLLFENDGWGFRAYSGYGVWVDGCTIESNKKGGIYFNAISGFRICSYFEQNAAVGFRPTSPDYQIYSDIVLNGSGNDISLSDAFPCDSGIIEGCNLMDNTGAGRTSFVYNGGANNLSIKNCHSTNTNTTPLYAETYESQYKGANVSVENCGSFSTLISELRPVAAMNNTKSAYIDLRGPSATAVNPWLTYSVQNLAEQDFNTWSLISGGSTTSFQRSANASPAFGGRPVWQILSSAAGTSDNNGFTVPASAFAEFSGKLVWFGIWSYISDANCFAVPYTNQQSFDVNPLSTGVWQFSAVSFPWPASGDVICGVYKSGSATGSVYVAAPMLMPVGVSVQTALGSIYETRQWYGTAAPTAGAWQRGDVILNSTPSAGGSPGFVCVTAGTPGTWRAMANLA